MWKRHIPDHALEINIFRSFKRVKAFCFLWSTHLRTLYLQRQALPPICKYFNLEAVCLNGILQYKGRTTSVLPKPLEDSN